ncbi:MAG: hypothetical protein HYU77_14120 [Betaproteobacteria bacterium]|nr:hypothetical protein [Betaproteobacteria bacterium]
MNQEAPQQGHRHTIVEFVYLNSNAEVKFEVKWNDKLVDVWNVAYDKLTEAKKPTDQLECQTGESLMADLQLSLEELRERKVCHARKFQIRSETGGA